MGTVTLPLEEVLRFCAEDWYEALLGGKPDPKPSDYPELAPSEFDACWRGAAKRYDSSATCG